MADTEYTKGPWNFTFTEENGECFIIAANLGGMVGAALPWPTEIDARDFRRVIANARLIAAAPDLLELAWQYRNDLIHPPAPDSRVRRLKAIAAVIAKAEGRS